MKRLLMGILILTIAGTAWAAFPAKTYTFVNGTVADATEVNLDFDALYNGFSTGLNDINIYTIQVGAVEIVDSNRNLSVEDGYFADDVVITDDTVIGGDLVVSGEVSFTGADVTFEVTNDVSILGDLVVSGEVSFTGSDITFEVAGDLDMSGYDILDVGDIAIDSLTTTANLDIGAYDFRAATITPDGLTATRVVFAGVDGVLSDDSDLTFDTATLTATNIGAFTLAGKLTAGTTEIEGSAFDINGGDIFSATISGGLTWSAAQDLDSQVLTNVNIDSGSISGITFSGLETSGDIVYTFDGFELRADTSDGSDNYMSYIAGGGGFGSTRGGYIRLSGNEVAGGGDIVLNAGDTDGQIGFYTGANRLQIYPTGTIEIDTSATLVYESAQIRYSTVSPYDLHNPAGGVRAITDGGVWPNDAASANYLYGGANFPNGATIKQLIGEIYDDANASQVTITLMKNDGAGTETAIATCETTNAEDAGYYTKLSSVVSEVVDNTAYTYHIKSFHSVNQSSNLRNHGSSISYEVTVPLP